MARILREATIIAAAVLIAIAIVAVEMRWIRTDNTLSRDVPASGVRITHPRGFSVKVPEGWEHHIDVTTTQSLKLSPTGDARHKPQIYIDLLRLDQMPHLSGSAGETRVVRENAGNGDFLLIVHTMILDEEVLRTRISLPPGLKDAAYVTWCEAVLDTMEYVKPGTEVEAETRPTMQQ